MGRDGAVKIFSQTIPYLIIELINDEAVCRTAPATQGLLKTSRELARIECLIAQYVAMLSCVAEIVDRSVRHYNSKLVSVLSLENIKINGHH